MCHSQLITDITESTLFRLEKFTWLGAKTDFNYVPGFFFFPSSLSISHCVGPAWSLSQWGRTWLSSYLLTSDIFWLRMACVENGLCYWVCSIALVRRHHAGARLTLMLSASKAVSFGACRVSLAYHSCPVYQGC